MTVVDCFTVIYGEYYFLNATLLLSGIIVELRERDFIDGLSYTTKWDDTYTDNDGFFKLDFDKHQMGEGAGLEFEIKVKAKNDYHNFIVARHTLDNLDINLISQAVFSNHVVGTINTNGGNQNVINMEDIFETDHGFDVASKLENAYRFAMNNGVSANSLFQENRLKAFIDAGASGNRTNIVFPSPPRISFSQTGGRRERTIYHEWGHYYMWSLHGTIYPRLLDANACGFNIGDHGDNEEVHMSLAWIEGFADGIRNILDAAYLEDDLEYGLINPGDRRQLTNGCEIRRVPLDDGNPILNNGLRSELNIGLALYDMWDGSNTVPLTIPDPADPDNLTINTEILSGRFGNIAPHPFNDLDNTNLPVTPGTWVNGDNVQISFKDMMWPLLAAKNKSDLVANVFEYADKLMNDVLKDDCIGKKGAADCFRENRVMLDINGYESNTANSLDFNTSISGDDIFEEVSFGDFGKNFACIGFTDFIDYKRNPIETTAGHTVSFPNSSFSGGEISEDITDDLRLGFNFPNTQSTFNLNAATPSISTGVTMNTCGNVTWEFGNTSVRLGIAQSPVSAVVRFNAGSQFITNPGTEILITDGSTLIIEEGATMRIGPNTQIILDGPNAILEIRGNLVLEDGATFQPVGGPNGQGFVRFNQQYVNSGSATTYVNVGNNSAMIFEASSSSTKVLEVASTDFWINDQGKSFRFTLKNGKAEMAHEAMMNLGCRVTLDGALVEKLPSAGHYRGIVLWNTGYLQVIRNSTFKEASEAVHFIGRNGGSRLIALDNQFTNNYNGLRLTGGSFWLRQANLSDNNGYGLVATGQQRTSTLFQSTVNRNNFKGIRYESNVGAGLNLHTNDILENTIGVKFISRGNLNMKCNQVHGIAGFGSPIGLEFYHGNLNMTKNLFRTGNNSFKDNEKSILFPNGVGIEPKIELNNGWNRLSNKDAGSPDFYNSLEGQLDVSNAIKLAENNHWDLNNNIPEFNYQPFFTNYGNYQTYYLTRMFGLNVLAPTTLDDNGLTLNQSQFTEDWTSECTNNLKWKRSPGGLGGIFPVGEGTIVISTSFNNKHLSECVEQILVTTADTLVTDEERINLWHELLTYDGYPEEIDKVDEYYLSVAETQLFDVLGNYLLEKDSIYSGLIQDDVVQDVLEVCDFWEQELVGDTSVYSTRFRNKINLSKGHLYHMIDDNAAALNQFGSMQVWADSFALYESGYWMCHINNLEQLNASSYDADLLFSLPECTFSENSNVFYKRSPERIQKSKIELEERFSIFPNPTKDYFNISFFTDQETTVSISLVDIYGKKIKEYGSMDTYIGDNRGRMSTEGLRAGTYFVQLTVDGRTEFKKLVLVD